MTMDSAIEARNATASISELAWGSGLELVAKLADGSIRRPSMAETLPFTLLSPEEGKVRLLAIPEGRFCNLTNTVHGGFKQFGTGFQGGRRVQTDPIGSIPSAPRYLRGA
jgi:hypothetical protein